MKITKTLLLLALVFCMLFNAVACTKVIIKNHHPAASDTSDATGEVPTEGTASTDKATTDTSPIETDNSNKNDLKRYSLIADKNNAVALSAAAELNMKLAKLGFSLPLNESSVYEIIIGNSKAPETSMAIEQLKESTKDYIIQFAGKKIVIVAKNDQALSEACGVFYDKYIEPLPSSTMNYKDGSTTFGVSKTLTTLAFANTAQYSIVFRDVSSAVKEKINALAAKIKTVTGVSSIVVGEAYNTKKNQIIVGKSSYQEVLKALHGTEENEYVLSKVDNKIIIAGNNDTTTILAIDRFISLLDDAKASNPTAGSFSMALPSSTVDAYCVSLSKLPRYPNATYSTTSPSGAGISQLYYKDASASGINSYVAQLATLGYKKTEDNSINGNRFVTCYGKNGLVHISYLAYNKSLTVILDELKNSVYKTSEPSYTKVTDTSLAVMSLDYTLSNETHSSGMSYIVTLEDGRYIIFDGGYRNDPWKSDDIYYIYNYLKDNNKRKDGKIVIAAWILTHGHKDHSGAFNDFAKNHGSKVTLEYIICNPGDPTRYVQTANTYLTDTLPTIMSTYYPKAKKLVPHTGQKLTFCNTTFEVICSQESHAPNKMELVNDGSLILRMSANGVTTMFLADTEQQTTNLLINMYNTTLKSDIVQLAHHGFSGGSTALYQKIAPKWSLWTTSQATFNERSKGSGTGNAQAQNKWLAQNSTCYVADGNIEILKFVGGTSKISVSTYKPNSAKT